MAAKVVIFDLFDTLVSEFAPDRPSHTEVAQILGLPVSELTDRVRDLCAGC